ncbi:MAG TPA: 4'-phosphopantetheinyl transferase superfamily protein [Pyrinomonadaceae bacterium]|jgi:4'-phosphopantetheinyl transferase|nr:4'-phosphopantetheinyl transferase superfamily protein [Pyrinomonadaceae bacterium]
MHDETSAIPKPSPRRDPLGGAEVHVWRASLKQPPEVLSALAATLSPEELERAARFHFRKDRDSFVVARGALRDILGRYLGVPPRRVRFTYGEFGKPALAAETCGGLPLSFNLSHSHELACCAVACGREVGVDVEHLREGVEVLSLAGHFFSRAEVAALGALPPEQRLRGFFNCWTRKEAYIKARGEGLSHPLDAFTVSLEPGSRAALLSTERDPAEAARWTLTDLPVGDDYAAALACEGPAPVLRRRDWNPRNSAEFRASDPV